MSLQDSVAVVLLLCGVALIFFGFLSAVGRTDKFQAIISFLVGVVGVALCLASYLLLEGKLQ